MSRAVWSIVALPLFVACAGADATSADADLEARFGAREGSSEGCAILRAANEADPKELARAGLDGETIANLTAFRLGNERWFSSLAELGENVDDATAGLIAQLAASNKKFTCGLVDVQLLAFNDFHGNLKPPSGSSGRITTGPLPTDVAEAGGAEFLATHVKNLRARNPNTLVVAAGDVVGATPLISALFHDEPAIESMNALGLDITTVGNHEFDEGPDELVRLQNGGCHPVDGCADGDGFDGAKFRYLAANVVRNGKTLFPSYAVRSFRGARIGFIGVTLEGTPLVTSPTGTVGLSFKDEAETVNALVPELQKKGVQAIVLLIHEGGATTGLFNECAGISGPLFEIVNRLDPAVDVVVAGHTNAAHVCNLGGKLVTSAASFGRLVTSIDMTIDEKTGHVVSLAGKNVIATRDVAKDEAQTTIITKYDALSAPLANRVVGAVTADLLKPVTPAMESPLGDVIADAQLAATRANGAVAAFMNPGGVRADITFAPSPAGEAPGAVTFGEAFTVQPFGNTLVTLTVTGAQLKTMLEQQWALASGAEKTNLLQVSEGFTYAADTTKPIGSRVDPASIKIAGKTVDPASSFRITVNAFLADGGDGFAVLKEGTARTPGGLDLDALLAHFAQQKKIAPPNGPRVVIR
jgi:5'-nucleotidase